MLDTLKYSKQLQELGLSEAQAKAHAQALYNAAKESKANSGGRFDTLAYALHLESAGVDLEQANAQARALHELMMESIATKEHVDGVAGTLRSGIKLVEQRLEAKIDAVEQSLRSGITAVEQRLEAKIDRIHWMLGVLIALNAAVLVKLVLL
ncbi:CCDC90 family protein [Nitrococcus mobilis]|uniref:DUF1640 domain-containing protein n=1 Tax=Nitrococcus mobilis Nb-231 TaxID=314278 RepID=A4BKZ4_9GAMM|nr:hypothetical protein [Nitrococcus mobilis]EAR22982.1 hypothetical protein NB231_14218 [Nitrococcus mobilis Nb-231]